MKRTMIVMAGLLVVLASFGFGGHADAQTIADKTWWHTRLSQAQRDALILKTALAFSDNALVSKTCKTWVQDLVVYKASSNVVYLPLNSPYCDWQWVYSYDVEAIAMDRWDGGVSWMPGQIVQAQVKMGTGSGPHTFVIVSADRWNVTVIECNWRLDGKVRRRTVDWPTLQSQILHYTLYHVK